MFRRSFIILAAFLVAFLVLYRIARYAAFAPDRLQMPAEIADEEERRLFQSPGGKYTQADIAANGNELPSQKYRGFRAVHDDQPRPGDRLCPITRTKANPVCTWTINGQTYEFCCPPCIPEFVRKAKQNPSDIEPASTLVARAID